MTVTRTIELNDLEPQELATLFAAMAGDKQALFFAAIWQIAKDWPGAGWCQQSCDLVSHLDKDGRDALTTLADHVNEGSEWKSLAMRAIDLLRDVERETSWGQPTFGPTVSEELGAVQDKLLAIRKRSPNPRDDGEK